VKTFIKSQNDRSRKQSLDQIHIPKLPKVQRQQSITMMPSKQLPAINQRHNSLTTTDAHYLQQNYPGPRIKKMHRAPS
jgi:trehalose-6-phosphate synthase